MFHVLLGYSTGVLDEAAMQFFLWGNGKPSLFTVGTCLLYTLMFPHKLGVLIRAFRRGRRSSCIRDWDFLALLPQSADSLQARIFTKKHSL